MPSVALALRADCVCDELQACLQEKPIPLHLSEMMARIQDLESRLRFIRERKARALLSLKP